MSCRVEDLESYGSFGVDPSAFHAFNSSDWFTAGDCTYKQQVDDPHRADRLADPKITGLVALCEVGDVQPPSTRIYRFEVSEMARLANGDLVVLRDRLGWTSESFGVEGPPDLAETLSTEAIVVLPDEDDPCWDPHPWEWLVELAARRGLSVTVEQLKEVPYSIYLSEAAVELCT